MVTALILGLLFGFFGAMPLAGPIALLILSRGMEGRFREGMFTALGASAAETIYAFLAFLGFSAFLTQFTWVLPVSKGLAAIVLTILGFSFIRKRPPEPGKTVVHGRGRHALGIGFLLTALNPTLVATWSAATTTLYSLEVVEFQPQYSWLFALGVFAGDMAWYWLMLVLTTQHRLRFGPQVLLRVLQVMGIGLIALAAWFLVTLVQMLAA